MSNICTTTIAGVFIQGDEQPRKAVRHRSIRANMLDSVSPSNEDDDYFGFAYDASSDTNWILLADPNDVPMMEILYLNGVSTPFIETADVDFNTLGMQTRCYFDFGVAPVDHRAGVYSDGTGS